uniref:E3 ubiquitin-protein ligase SHPRH-like n=1 Tax=Diabrotica virgifera virgifera TaxID=50390 RepID=A0A6P7GAB7_DIAVI
MSGRKNTLIKHGTDTVEYLDYIPVVSKRGNVVSSNPEKFIKVNIPKKSCRQWYLGEILMGSINSTFPGRLKPVKVSFKFKDDSPEEEGLFDKIKVLFDSDPVIVTNYTNNASFIKEVMSLTKTLSFDFSCRGDNLFLRIYFTQLPLPQFYPKIGNCLKDLFIQLFGQICSNTYDNFENTSKKFRGKSEIQNLYDKLKEKRKTDKFDYNVEENVQHHNLKSKLKPYQQESVKWMLYRERMEDSKTDFLDPFYILIKLTSNNEIYFNKYTGFVCNEKPITTLSTKVGILGDEMGLGKAVEVLSCILLNPKIEPKEDKNDHSRKRKSFIDESNDPIIKIPQKKSKQIQEPKKPSYVIKPREVQVIKPREVQVTKSKEVKGKTIHSKRFENVDRISVRCVCRENGVSEETAIKCTSCNIYQHPKCLGYTKSLGRYFCPQCWINQPLIESKATLIVTPVALKNQWCNEIAKHVKGNLRVLQYQGHSVNPVYPTELKEYDIVLTTYSMLQHELKPEANTLRQGKKSFKPCCPLTRIKWWRLCLDEAQTVDTPDHLVSVMARKIEAVHRWAVTGTSISKNVSDLYCLIDCLQISPYNDIATWQKILYQPYLVGNEEPLLNFLSTIMWRTSKKDVADQADIPKQTYLHHTLDFCAMEKYFYKKQLKLSGHVLEKRCSPYNPAICLDNLAKQNIFGQALENILEPVLDLRRMCVIMTSSKMKAFKYVLNTRISDNFNDMRDCFQLIISKYNGLAGIHLLLKNPQEAINAYREVLRLVAKFPDEDFPGTMGFCRELSSDKLQVIHTLYNLAEVLDMYPPEHPTLRDTSLRNDCEEWEQKYLRERIDYPSNWLFDYYTETMDRLQKQFLLKDGQWYSDGLDWIVLNGLSKEFHAKIDTACKAANIENKTRDVRDWTLLRLLCNWENALYTLRKEVFAAVADLYENAPHNRFKVVIKKSVVTKAMNCHLRPQEKREKSTKKCPTCLFNKCLEKYELTLCYYRECGYNEHVYDWKPTPTLPEIVMQ